MTITELFESLSSHIVLVAEIDLTHRTTGDPLTVYYATEGFTVAAADTLAPGRHYPGRLEPPTIPWTRHRGDAAGGSTAADTTSFVIVDLDGTQSHLGDYLLAGPITLRIGSPSLDLSAWEVSLWRGLEFYKQDTSWVCELESLDGIFDQLFPRRALRALGDCLQLVEGGEWASIPHDSTLDPGSFLAVEAVVSIDADIVFLVVGKGYGTSTGWDLTHREWGGIRWAVRDTSGAHVFISADLPKGVPVRVRATAIAGELHLYFDEVLVAGPSPFTGSIDPSTADILMLKTWLPWGTSQAYLDDLRIWIDDEPTQEEFGLWSFGELPTFAHLRAALYLRFNEGFGTETGDDSFHGHQATLTSDSMWSSLREGLLEPGKLRPEGAGHNVRVAGVPLARLVRQVHDGEVRGIGPVDEGGAWLWPKRSWTSTDITITEVLEAGGSEQRIYSAVIDFGGLRAGQWLRVTIGGQDYLCRLTRPAQIRENTASVWHIFTAADSQLLPETNPPTQVIIETTGYSATRTIFSFADNTVFGGNLDLQPIGSTFTVSGSSSNDGTYTVAAMDATTITTVEALQAESAPSLTTLAWDEVWDYTVDLKEGSITLLSQPIQPLAIDFRGPAAAGDTRADLMAYVAGRFGATVDAASIAAFSAQDPEPAGYWLGPEEATTGRELLDQLAGPDAYGFNEAGEFEVALREIPVAAALTLDHARHFFHLGRSGIPSPNAEQVVRWGRNYVDLPEGDVVGEADPTRAAWGAAPWRKTKAPVTSAISPAAGVEPGPVIDSPYATEAGAFALASRIWDQERYGVQVWRGSSTLLPLLAAARRDAILITSDAHPDLGAAGQLVLILSLELNFATMELILTTWRPDDV